MQTWKWSLLAAILSLGATGAAGDGCHLLSATVGTDARIALRVSTFTQQTDPSQGEFQLRVAQGEQTWFFRISPNVTREFTLTGARSGTVQVELREVPANCQVEGENSRSVSVRRGVPGSTRFTVTCRTPA